jgi:hypothetical protein
MSLPRLSAHLDFVLVAVKLPSRVNLYDLSFRVIGKNLNPNT